MTWLGEITGPQTGIYGFCGFADSPRPLLMMCISCATVNCVPTSVSAGTSLDTPPCPCSPWQAEHANCTNRCAPIATCGSLGFAPASSPPPHPATTPTETSPKATNATAAATRRMQRYRAHRQAMQWTRPQLGYVSSPDATCSRSRVQERSGRPAADANSQPVDSPEKLAAPVGSARPSQATSLRFGREVTLARLRRAEVGDLDELEAETACVEQPLAVVPRHVVDGLR